MHSLSASLVKAVIHIFDSAPTRALQSVRSGQEARYVMIVKQQFDIEL